MVFTKKTRTNNGRPTDQFKSCTQKLYSKNPTYMKTLFYFNKAFVELDTRNAMTN